ncbi:hypothetical protein [Nocardioides marmoribigeumensis]|uniref:Uncharacterized protein n=1 Tax=Nocardioides marmoribigeumensis TaxID=433649 RepID=A0ABU2BT83_9ACTN|nr:hypothetical protein [Nocardioides marmoribigeumensis]MDR7361846.1 hypothetical protein [Nocardioides marmoribigeumensis]
MSTLVLEHVTGFRQFRIGDDGLLPAHVGDHPWASPVMVARCSRGHAAPTRGCSCGLDAWYDAADARAHALPGEVTAVVRASGTVLLGEHGWRAERAEVVAVALPGRRTSTDARRERVRRVVAAAYPHAELLEADELERRFAPDDLSALGVERRSSGAPDLAVRWRWCWVLGVLGLYAVPLAPPEVLRAGGWVLLVAALVGWQAWLVRRARAG